MPREECLASEDAALGYLLFYIPMQAAIYILHLKTMLVKTAALLLLFTFLLCLFWLLLLLITTISYTSFFSFHVPPLFPGTHPPLPHLLTFLLLLPAPPPPPLSPSSSSSSSSTFTSSLLYCSLSSSSSFCSPSFATPSSTPLPLPPLLSVSHPSLLTPPLSSLSPLHLLVLLLLLLFLFFHIISLLLFLPLIMSLVAEDEMLRPVKTELPSNMALDQS